MPQSADQRHRDHGADRRAVIYLRVSSREQVDGYSIPAQRKACLARISDEKWILAAEFTDAGESARTQDRPQFQAMLQTLRDDPTISVLIIHKLDRLARNLEDHVMVTAQLRKLGVQLVSVTETLEESASGRLVEGIMASIAEFYSANLAQEVRKGMTEKARRGGWPTMAPVGYRNIRLDTPGSRRGEAVIVPDEGQAPLVQKAFELYATGQWGINELHKEMARRGLRGRGSRGGAISRSKLAKMLSNRVYIGKVAWDGLEYEGTHEPLIDEPLFHQVQDVIASHDRAGDRRRRNTHYLKGTLYCGACGSRLSTMNAKGRYLYYYCLGAHGGRTDCDQPYAKADQLEEQVADLYRSVTLPAAIVRSLRSGLQAELERRQSNRIRSAELLERQLSRLDTERGKALDAYYAGAIAAAQLRDEQRRLSTEASRVTEQLTRTRAQLTASEALTKTALTLAGNLAEAYGHASPQVRRRYNQALLGRLDVIDGQVRPPKVRLQAPRSRNRATHGTAG